MSHYRANLRDIEFTLFEVLGRGEVLARYPDMDEETARTVLEEIGRLASGPLAESYAEADRNPPTFDPETHTVALPHAFRRSYSAYLDSEWWRLDAPEEFGGVPAPPSLRWAATELVLGANPAIAMYASFGAFSRVLAALGTPEQRRLGALMTERQWVATMQLTEPDAGSDVGAARATAHPQPDGSWHLRGVKRFITSGEHDLSENIVHFVLARPVGVEGAGGPGTKGLSLFLVPKFHVDLETGELGERNGVFATAVEHKMGLKVSTTCEMRFGEIGDLPAVGSLLGEVHDGIAQMFRIIEHARMLVGTKAIATLSSGYLGALDYARERIQGGDLAALRDKTAPRIPIVRHPDVRRSLMLQKSHAEGLRALVLYTASVQDRIDLAEREGREAEPGDRALNDLLLPVVKGFGSERSWTLLGTESLQTFGGSGFLQDFPLEQYVRDAKIDTLYEGTTAIQAQDLFFRKIARDGGRALSALGEEIAGWLAEEPGGEVLAHTRDAVGRALQDIGAMVAALTGHLRASEEDPARIYLVGLHTTRLLTAIGELLVGWLLARQADIAARTLESPGTSEEDLAFYRGKIAAARFFAAEVLPRLGADRRIVEAATSDLMELDDRSF